MAGHDMRTMQIRKIKVAVRQLGLDEETYRALLMQVTGKSSCAQMSMGERDAVLNALKARGFKPTNNTFARHRPRDVARGRATKKGPMLRKVEALLADGKRPWDYAHSMARKMFRIDRLEFLNGEQLHQLIAALQIDANRRMHRECA